MSFSAEINDFVKGFQAGSQVGGDIMDRKAKKEQAELDRAFKEKDFEFEKEKFGDSKAYREKALAYREKRDATSDGFRTRAERRADAAQRRADEGLKLRRDELERRSLLELGANPDAPATGRAAAVSYADDYDFEEDTAAAENEVAGFADEPDGADEELGFKRGGLVPHANTGGAIPEEPPVEEPQANTEVNTEGKGDLLVERAKPILKEVFDDEAARLGEKTEAIATKPKKNQSRISVISGEGAASPDEIKAIDKVIDPKGEMEPYRKGAARLVTAYNFFMEKGETEKARNVAKRIVGFHKQAAQTRGKLAMAALERGDLRAASKLVTDAYNEDIIDGSTMEAAPTPRGTVMYKTNNTEFAQQQGEIGAQELWTLAGQVADGSAFIDRMTDLAATSKSKGKGSYTKDVREAALAKKNYDTAKKQFDMMDFEDGSEEAKALRAELSGAYDTYQKALEKAETAAEKTKRPRKVLLDDLGREYRSASVAPPAEQAVPEEPEEKSDGSWWNPSTFSEGVNRAINSTIPGGGDWFGIQSSKQAVPAQPAPQQAPAQPAPQAAPVTVRSKEELDALPSGTVFVAPDGTVRRKP
jgi:hypothetical protein